MDVVLNERTETVHRRTSGSSELETACGVEGRLDSDQSRRPDQLQRVPLEAASSEYDISKCGRCFDEGNGY